MNFFSLEFGLLFIIFLPIYWGIKNLSVQNFSILFFNYLLIFTLGSPYIAITLLFYTIFIHFAALYIAYKKTKFALLSSISLALCNLCFFKYYSSIKIFFSEILQSLGLSPMASEVLMPLGISFYTFASITYLYSIYQAREEKQNTNLQSFEFLATYLSFFPTFVAGPIMRAEFFFSQLHKKRIFDSSFMPIIFALLLFGIIKKVIIANYAGIYTGPILSDPTHQNSISLLLGIYGYALQIYCDFSGYVNLVTAFGLMIGFKLPLNFNMPYIARNLKDFWARWHISLSNFIRDFIYIPLGGNKKGFLSTQIFVLISFGLSGIWHGNTANFLIWGLLHGIGIVFINMLKVCNINFKKVPLLPKFLTFHYVCFCWIFFYYSELEEALTYLHTLIFHFSLSSNDWGILILVWLIFTLYQFCVGFFELSVKIIAKIPSFLMPIIMALLAMGIFSIMPNGIPNFIYAGF